ncbi:hypothetical protein CYCD_15320 [Tenuifilaceae bacterium CYCD]|nr:hypothetical protein CYCD_15320 [Tenuifilaceae bacterium CYCD]
MELKESNKFQELLTGSNFVTGNIIFDDNEIIIQRDAKAFWYSFIVALFILLGPILHFINGSLTPNDSMFFYNITLSIAVFIYLIFSFIKLVEIRKTSNISFPTTNLKSISVISRKKAHIRITILLKDSRKTSVTVHNDTYFRDFIDTIRKYNVEIK